MASNSGRRSGSSGRSTGRKRVVIGAEETVRVRYNKDAQPQVESERRRARQNQRESRGGSSAPARSSAARAGKRLSAAKRDERQRRQRSIQLRRGLFVLAVTAVIGMCCWGAWALYRAPVLPVRSVEVAGVRRLSAATVEKRAAIPTDATLVRLSTRAVRERLESHPWVASANVRRVFPDTVRITIKERTPAAIVDAGGTSVWVASTDGLWLGKRSKETTGLVVVRDAPSVDPTAGAAVNNPEIENAISVLQGISPQLRKRIVSVSAPTLDETALLTKDDVEIFIGSAENIELKDRVIRELLSTKKGLVYINVRTPESPTWRGLTP